MHGVAETVCTRREAWHFQVAHRQQVAARAVTVDSRGFGSIQVLHEGQWCMGFPLQYRDAVLGSDHMELLGLLPAQRPLCANAGHQGQGHPQ